MPRWSALLLLLLVSSIAQAQGSDPAAADALFRAGRDAMKKADWAVACSKFAESQRLDPAPGTLLNLAQCEEQQGRTASAVQHYRDLMEVVPSTDPRSEHAKARLAALLPRVPKLTIRLDPGTPSGATVSRNGVVLGQAAMGTPLPVDPGDHQIMVTAPGRKDSRTLVRMQPGETRTVIARVGEPQEQTSPSGSSIQASGERTTVESGSAPSLRRTLGYVSGGLGLVGLGAGTYFALRAKSRNDEALSKYCEGTVCTDPAGVTLTNESRDAGKLSIVGFVAGGALLATGTALIITAPPSSSPQASRRVVVGVGGPGTWLGVNVTGRLW